MVLEDILGGPERPLGGPMKTSFLAKTTLLARLGLFAKTTLLQYLEDLLATVTQRPPRYSTRDEQ